MANQANAASPPVAIFAMPVPSQPRVSFYISRDDHKMVPLIPADELPLGLNLQGIPRVLNSDQVFALQYIGMLPSTGLTFKLENESAALQRSTSEPSHTRSHSNIDPTNFLPPDAYARQALINAQQQASGQPRPAHEVTTNWRSKATLDDPQAVIDAIINTKGGAEAAAQLVHPARTHTAMPPSGNMPDQDKKEFCTHWIRHGECDYAQQGCLYKHEMPDKATLMKIGFRSIPRWWVEQSQAVRIGGARATVGPLVSPTVWMKTPHTDRSDDEDPQSDNSVSKLPNAEEQKAPTVTAFSKAGSSEDAEQRITPASQTSSRPLGVKVENHTDGDLIDFDAIVSTVSRDSSSTTMSTANEKKAPAGPATPPSSPDVSLPIQTSPVTEASKKFFIPAGKSTEAHGADVEKRSERSPAKHHHPNSGIAPASLDKQIQLLQKYNGGIMASKHAPTNAKSANASSPAMNVTKRSKTGCRVRRPAASSSSSSSTNTVVPKAPETIKE